MPIAKLTLTSLKKKIARDRESGGLIFITKADSSGNPLNFHIEGNKATSGVWRYRLDKPSLKWILVYQKIGKDSGRVWLGDYQGVSPVSTKYQIVLTNIQGPLDVKFSLRELTGKTNVQHPVYLAPKATGSAPSAKNLVEDIADIFDEAGFEKLATETQQLILARLGQGKFRERVLRKWGNACAVTGTTRLEVIRASHIVPWKATDKETHRLDPDNGLPLVATLDALFDKGLISFTSSGDMLVSKKLSKAERKMFDLPASLRHPPSQKQKRFLQYHQENVFDH